MKAVLNLYSFIVLCFQDLNKKISALRICEDEGLMARVTGVDCSENPYPKDTLEHNAWDSGYYDWL